MSYASSPLVTDRWHRSPRRRQIPQYLRTTDVYPCTPRRCILWEVSETRTRRTNINLDTELVDAAAAVLGTARTTDTVHAALSAVIDRAARERLARRDLADLTPGVLEQLRSPPQLA